MLRLSWLPAAILLLALAPVSAAPGSAGQMSGTNSSSQDEPGKIASRMEWFSNAKFGMFIHWGPYSRLGGEWEGKRVGNDRNAEWIMNFLRIPRDEYRMLAHEFNPVEFNAEDWVSLAEEAGMKYLVFTAKHHDGFAMYDSEVSGYNILDWTQFSSDPLRELSEACRERGIRFGFYYSQREDWDEPFAYGNTWDFDFDPEVNLEAFEQKYLETKSKPQLRELLTKFGPVDLIWFDRGLYTQEQARDLRSLVGKLQPDCLVNGRIGNYNSELMGDFQELNDNGMPSSGIEEYWETPQTLNDTWGYSSFDNNWKRPGEVIRRLVEIVSKGGNYLLNIGPDGQGRIPDPSREILKETGRWMRLHGESIYNTQASPLEELDWGFCTRKGPVLFLHITEWPQNDRLVVKGLMSGVRSARPLVGNEKDLGVSSEGGYPVIDIGGIARDKYVTVLKLELDGEIQVAQPVVSRAADGSYLLNFEDAITRGRAVKRFNRKGGYHISGWESRDDSVSWNLEVPEPGSYRLGITYSALPSWAGQKFRVEAAGKAVESETAATGDWYDYKTFYLGRVTLDGGERQVLKVSPAGPVQDYLMYFKEITLEPEGRN